jgi:hypothetical protein
VIETLRRPESTSLAVLAMLADVDLEAAGAGYAAAHRVLTAASAADVRAALVDLVEGLDGAVGPAATQLDDVLPIDLSCGEGDPLLPRAAPYTLARLRLEMLLPTLVEQARHRLLALRRGDAV